VRPYCIANISWHHRSARITWPLTSTLTLSTSWMQARLGTIVCKFGGDPAISVVEVAIWQKSLKTDRRTDRQTDGRRTPRDCISSWNELIITRKPCCHKGIARCRSCCFWFKVRRQHDDLGAFCDRSKNIHYFQVTLLNILCCCCCGEVKWRRTQTCGSQRCIDGWFVELDLSTQFHGLDLISDANINVFWSPLKVYIVNIYSAEPKVMLA